MERQAKQLRTAEPDPDEIQAAAKTVHDAPCAYVPGPDAKAMRKPIADVLQINSASRHQRGVNARGQFHSNPPFARARAVPIGAPVAPSTIEGNVVRADCGPINDMAHSVSPQPLRGAVRPMVRFIRIEDQLRHSEQLWRTIFAGASEAILLADGELKILAANAKAAELFECEGGELANMSLLQLCPEEAQSALSARLELASEEQIILLETELRKQNELAFPAELRVRRFQIDSIPYYEVIARDLDADPLTDSASANNERDSWTSYSWENGNPVTAAYYAGGPISQLMPTYFEELASQYASIIECALEEKAYKITHDISGQLRQLAERIGHLRAAPRDVVELHTTVLKRKMAEGNLRRKQACHAEGRFLLVELLGYLATYYRDRAIGLPETGSEQ